MAVTRLNHAVLYVRDADRTAAFFRDQLGFEIKSKAEMRPGLSAIFIRAGSSPNDHDLGLFSIGDAAGDSQAGRSTVGLYHLAFEVETLAELSELKTTLAESGALVGQSNHGVSKSLYAKDPDGLEVELMWAVPEELLTDQDALISVAPLDLEAEIARFGGTTPGRKTA